MDLLTETEVTLDEEIRQQVPVFLPLPRFGELEPKEKNLTDHAKMEVKVTSDLQVETPKRSTPPSLIPTRRMKVLCFSLRV